MKNEILSLERMGTWDYVQLPPRANIIGTKFVYKIKHKADGSIDRYKARLVAQGFKQVKGVDFKDNDRYAPVTRMTAACIILSWAATMDYEIHQVDIKSTYLYGKLNDDEIIYIRPPPGNLSNCPDGHVLKLQKALYGLKQAGRRWYQTLENILTQKMKFKQSNFDQAVFYAANDQKIVMILFIHVDDITIVGIDTIAIDLFKKQLRKHVELSDGGEIHWLLGIEIRRN